MRYFFCVVLIVFMQGCATVGTGKPFQNLQSVSEQKALLYLYRDDDTLYMRKPDVHINGKFVTELPNKSYYSLELSPGTYNIQSIWGWDVGAPPIDYNLELLGGKTYFVRLWTGSRNDGLLITGIPSYPVMPDISFFSAAFLQTESQAMPLLSKTRAVSEQ